MPSARLPLALAALSLVATATPVATAPQTARADGTGSVVHRARAALPVPPARCARLRPDRWRPATGHPDAAGTLRVFAIQYKQAVRHVRSYRAYRRAMRCLMEDFVVPYLRPGEPALVVFPEDVG